MAEETIQPNRTVLAQLTLFSPTTADNGPYTLQALNAGGILNISFTVNVPTLPTPPDGGLTGGQKAGVAIGVIVAIIFIVLAFFFVRSMMKRTPYERMGQRGSVEEATGHMGGDGGAEGAGGDGSVVTFQSADSTQEREGLTSGQRSYGGTATTHTPSKPELTLE